MAKVIDATLKLIDQFSPTIRAVNGVVKTCESTLHAVSTAAKGAGTGMKGYAANAKEAEKINERTAKSIEKVSKSMSGMTNLAVVGGLTAAATEGWKLSESLDKAVGRVAMVGDLSSTETSKIKKNIVEVSNQTGVAAESIAAGTQKIVTGGVEAGNAMGYMKNYIVANKIAGQELDATVQQLTAVQKAYNLTTTDTAALNDQVVVTAKLAKTEAGNVTMALSTSAKSAADAGVSVQQFGAAYAMMVSRGTDSAKASASLSGLFDSFSKASPKAVKAAQEFGIEMNQAHIKAIGFPAFLKEIYDKTGGNEEAIGKIIKDVDAYKQAMIMCNDDGMAEFTANLDKINKSGGAAGAALARAKPPAQSAAKAMNQLKNAGVELVDGLAPLFTRTATMINNISNAFNSLSDGQKSVIFDVMQAVIVFEMLNMTAGKAIGVFGKMFGTVSSAASAIANAGGVIPLLTGKLASLVGHLKMIGTAARLMFMNPVGIAIMTIIGLTYLIYTHWEPLSKFFKEFCEGVSNNMTWAAHMIDAALDAVGSFIAMIIAGVANNVTWAINLIKAIPSAIGNTAAAIKSIVSSMVHVIAAFILGVVGVVVDVSGTFLSTWISEIQVVISGAIAVFGGLIDFITGVFSGDWGLAWEGIVQIFSGIFGTIAGVCETVLGGIRASINAVISGINSVSIDIPEWVPVVGGQHYQPNVPMLAGGTDNWQGGPAMIHDAGAEIVDLPQGSRVIPHDKSLQNEYERGRSQAGKGGINIEKIADTIIIREEADLDKLVNKMVQKLGAHAMNQAEGAI